MFLDFNCQLKNKCKDQAIPGLTIGSLKENVLISLLAKTQAPKQNAFYYDSGSIFNDHILIFKSTYVLYLNPKSHRYIKKFPKSK